MHPAMGCPTQWFRVDRGQVKCLGSVMGKWSWVLGGPEGRINIQVQLRLGNNWFNRLFLDLIEAVDCTGVYGLGKTSRCLFLHLVEEDVVFRADSEVLFANEILRDFKLIAKRFQGHIIVQKLSKRGFEPQGAAEEVMLRVLRISKISIGRVERCERQFFCERVFTLIKARTEFTWDPQNAVSKSKIKVAGKQKHRQTRHQFLSQVKVTKKETQSNPLPFGSFNSLYNYKKTRVFSAV